MTIADFRLPIADLVMTDSFKSNRQSEIGNRQ